MNGLSDGDVWITSPLAQVFIAVCLVALVLFLSWITGGAMASTLGETTVVGGTEAGHGGPFGVGAGGPPQVHGPQNFQHID